MTSYYSHSPSNNFTDIVDGRRSIRRYDSLVKISRLEMEEMLKEATLAPSSVNMQPWRFLIIESDEGKAGLAPLARFNQLQVQTSAAVIAVFGDLQSYSYGEHIYSRAVELGLMPAEVKEQQLPKIMGYYQSLSPQQIKEVVMIDSALATMQLMLVARKHGYDTNAIGGYDKEQIASAFGMDASRYVPVMLLSIGKAAEEGYASYRLPIDQIATWK